MGVHGSRLPGAGAAPTVLHTASAMTRSMAGALAALLIMPNGPETIVKDVRAGVRAVERSIVLSSVITQFNVMSAEVGSAWCRSLGGGSARDGLNNCSDH